MIQSRDNERLKLVRKLHERRWRDKLGLFFVEGEDAVAAATAEPVELLRAGEDVEPKLLAEVATAPHPPRVIAVYRRGDLPAWEERAATLALWRLADPGNVGTLIRTADAFGAAVALSRGCADRTSAKALRGSAGAVFRVPVLDFNEAPSPRIALLTRGGVPIAEAALPEPATFVLGAEREGVPPEVVEGCEAAVSIPIAEPAESLNVAAAGAIALYEWRRQTQTESSPPRQGERSNQP